MSLSCPSEMMLIAQAAAGLSVFRVSGYFVAPSLSSHQPVMEYVFAAPSLALLEVSSY